MISRSNDNFIVRHYDWIVAGVAALSLVAAVAYFVLSMDADADADAAAAVAAIDRQKPSESGVEKTDLAPFATALRQAKSPMLVAEIDGARESMLASERRIKCRCGNIMAAGLVECPACKASLVVINKEDEAQKKVDSWKARYGVESDGNDKDGDGFTNQEEYAAGTDPTDAKDHPDYLDSLKLTLPLKETYVPFALMEYTQLPNGWRCNFSNARRTMRLTATVGEEIFLPVAKAVGAAENKPTGFVLKSFTKKEEARGLIAGTMTKKMVDVSVAEIQRKSDGKIVSLVLQDPKRVKLTPIDVQASLVYERMGTKTFDVVTGDEIDLNGSKYEIVSVQSVEKGAEIVLKNKVSGQRKTLKALD